MRNRKIINKKRQADGRAVRDKLANRVEKETADRVG